LINLLGSFTPRVAFSYFISIQPVVILSLTFMFNSTALQNVQHQLSQFASQGNFLSVMTTAFGNRLNQQKLQALRQQWLSGNYSIIPEIQVLSHGELGSANGAYAAELDKIFVSSDFLATASSSQVTSLLLEEVGHRIDQILNNGVDSAGDEGEIFSLLVTGNTLSPEMLAGLKAQNDHGFVSIRGRVIAVENSIYDTPFDDILSGGPGNDSIFGSAGNDSLYGNSGDDYLQDASGNNYFEGGDGNDIINGSGGNVGNSTIHGGAGNDSISEALGNGIVYGESGDDTIQDGVGNDLVYGGDGNDTLKSVGGTDVLDGGSGDDNISGLADDTIYGGAGNDSLYRSRFMFGGAGDDFIDGIDNGNAFLSGNLGSDSIKGWKYNDTLIGGDDSLDSGNDLFGNDTLVGGDGDDFLYGGYGNDFLDGGYGNDFLSGGSGDDQLKAGSGNDSLSGGTGNDVYIIDADALAAALYTITESINGGVDTIDFRSTTGTGIRIVLSENSNPQNITTPIRLNDVSMAEVENVYGGDRSDVIGGNSLNNNLLGGLGNDFLSGSLGSDSLWGGNGNDELQGGSGNDVFIIDADIDSGLDSITEFANDGTDTIDFRTSSTAINIDLTATATQTLATGVQLAAVSLENLENIYGGSGNDTIAGNALNNYFIGGVGNDSITGGLGSDRYVIDADTDLGSDRIVEIAAGGTDALDFSGTTTKAITLNLASVANQLVATGVNVIMPTVAIENAYGGYLNDNFTGNSLNNYFIGGAGNDTLTGSAGNDYLTGSAGNDTFHFSGIALTGVNTVATVLGTDTISDFAVGVDKILLSKATFTGITSAAGVAIGTNFISVATDALADVQTAAIVYSTGTGNLFYNQNGVTAGFGTNGGNFAVLTGAPQTLAATDFTIAA
jgi:Ca2+-binding RTX toxin-like protein